MDAHPPDDDPHAKFRELCIVYGDFNRAAFLEEILNFIAGLWRNGCQALRHSHRCAEANQAACQASTTRTASRLCY